jgi:hypothetical protein
MAMTAVRVGEKEIEVLTESEFNSLMSRRGYGVKSGNLQCEVPSSNQIIGTTAGRLGQELYTHKNNRRHLRMWCSSIVMALGISLGVTYFSNNSTYSVAKPAPTSQIVSGTLVVHSTTVAPQ